MTNNKKTNNNNKPSQSTTPNTRPSFKIQYKTLDFSTLKNEEEKKKIEFENERKVICFETGLDLKDIQRIEREYYLFRMEGLVKMGNEYFIPDWYEYKLHEYVYRNKKIIQKENNKLNN